MDNDESIVSSLASTIDNDLIVNEKQKQTNIFIL
jgi:hypothetical protein